METLWKDLCRHDEAMPFSNGRRNPVDEREPLAKPDKPGSPGRGAKKRLTRQAS